MDNKEQEPEVLTYKLIDGMSDTDFLNANFGERMSSKDFDDLDGEVFEIKLTRE